MSTGNRQLNLPPVPLRNSEPGDALFRKSEHDEEPLRIAEQAASELFDIAADAAHLENKEIAHLCGVSVSLVEKWRSREARGCPSFVQLLMLPPAFHIELHKALNHRFGFGRQALLDLLDAVGRLSLEVGR